jgi:tetratricopeptide (TPR) repeat protein
MKLAALCRMKEYAAGIRSSELSLVEVSTTTGKEETAPEAAPLPGAESSPSKANEDRYLARARDEYAKGHVDTSLWTRALAQVGGDKDKAKDIYLDIRATAIRVAKRQEKATRRAQVVETLSKEPEAGFEAVRAALNDEALSKASKAARRGSPAAKRKLTILAGGALAFVMGTVGVVALWPADGPAHASRAGPVLINLAKPVAPATPNASPATNTAKAAAATGEDIVSRVQALEKEGNWNLLVIHTAEWTRKQPSNPEAWKTLSVGYLKLRQFTEAVDAATKATQLAPEDARLWQNLGQINLAVPRPAEALTAFRRATALSDQDIVSLAQEGTLDVQLGHLAEAKIAFDKALALNPDDVPTLCGAASLAQKEGRVKDAEAMTLQVASRDTRCPTLAEGETVRVASSAPAARVSVATPPAPNKPKPAPLRRPQ